MAQITPELLAKLIEIESGGNPRAVSPVGAQGVMQIMPDTARDPGYGVRPIADPFDPRQAVPFGRDYLGAMLTETGDMRKALAAYNAGLGNTRAGMGYADKVLSARPSRRAVEMAQMYGGVGDGEIVGASEDDKLDRQKRAAAAFADVFSDESASPGNGSRAADVFKDVFADVPSPQPAEPPSPAPQQASDGGTAGEAYRGLQRVGHGILNAGHGVTQRILNTVQDVAGVAGIDTTVGDDYNAALKQRNVDYQKWRQQHGAKPGETDYAAIVGEAAPYAAAPGKGLAQTVVSSVLAGLNIPQEGGDYSHIQSAVNAAVSGASGGTVYGLLKGVGAAAGLGQDKATKAYKIIQAHVKRAGKTLTESVDEAREALAKNPDLLLAEVGANTKLPQKLVAMPGEARELAEKSLFTRAYDTADRVTQEARKRLGAPVTSAQLKAAIDSVKKAAKPLYDKAYQQPIMFNEKLEAIIKTPSGRDALRAAARIAQDEKQEGLGQYLIKIADDGTIDATQVPNMKVWDYVKRGFDRMSGIAKRATGEDALKWDKRAIDGLRRELRDELVLQNKAYGDALGLYGDAAGIDTARELGLEFLGKNVDEIADVFSRLSEAEKIGYRIGAAQAIKNDAGKSASGAMLGARLRNSPNMRDKLAIIAPDAEGADALAQRFANEVRMQRNMGGILGGSQTAERLASMGNDETAGMAKDAFFAAQGQPSAIINTATRLWNELTRPGKEEARNIAARALFSGDQAAKTKALDELLRIQAAPNLSTAISPYARSGGALSAALLADVKRDSEISRGKR